MDSKSNKYSDRPCAPGVRPDILNYEDIRKMIPILDGHPKIVETIMHWLILDKCNEVHGRYCYTTGVPFSNLLIDDAYKIKKRIDNEEVLDRFADTPFVTVSNHPLGALDGIALIHLIASRRPKYRVMVNMILGHITAMRPNFIAVDQSASTDPAKRAVSVAGIRQALRQLADGEPIGFFPAGAMSKTNWKYKTVDREWQESVLQIIWRAKVPVIPIYFHDKNSLWCNFLGHALWQARSLRIPAEVFRKVGKTLHVSVGEPVSPEEQREHASNPNELGVYLREKTYALRGGE